MKFVVGDIHGNYIGLKQALERANFNYETDTLISLGDECDGLPDTFKVVEELMKIKNIILVRGNHSEWFLNWFRTGAQPAIWVTQGGQATLKSYDYKFNQKHYDFLNKSVYYYIDNNRVFVHGGFDKKLPIETQDPNFLMWDRKLISEAVEKKKYSKTKRSKFTNYDEVYVGHTTTRHWRTIDPINAYEIWLVDTGGGEASGKITVMNIDTKEYFQSDLNYYNYPIYDFGR